MPNLRKINYWIGGVVLLLLILSFLTFRERTFNVFLGSVYNFGGRVVDKDFEEINLKENEMVKSGEGNVTAGEVYTNQEKKEKISYEEQVKRAKSLPFSKGKVEEALGAENKFRVFDVKISKDGFQPDTIVVKKGDVAQLNFISDFDTDIESKDLKFFSFIPKGKEVNFSILTKYNGTYTFYCLNMCPTEGRFFGILEVRD